MNPWLRRGLALAAVLLGSALAAVSWLLRPPTDDALPATRLQLPAPLRTEPVEWGEFRVEWLAAPAPRLRVLQGGKELWSHPAGMGFVRAAQMAHAPTEARGMARWSQRLMQSCSTQELHGWEAGGDALHLSGQLRCGPQDTGRQDWRLTLKPSPAGGLDFALHLGPGPANHLALVLASEAHERFHGFGAQFGRVDFKGERFPVLTSEQGVGRGLQPLSLLADLSSNGAGGRWHSSYAGLAQFITNRGRALALRGDLPALFDLRAPEQAVIEQAGRDMQGTWVGGASPLALIEALTAHTGRMRRLPDWVMDGAVIGVQGGPARVHEAVNRLRAAGAPLAAVWLQDWVGPRKTSFGQQLWWNWTLDTQHYPGWQELVAALRAQGLRVLTYANPMLAADLPAGARRNLYEEARRQGFLVRRTDGSPYRVVGTSFPAGLVDLTHPGARQWMKAVLVQELAARGASGWMADFAEGLPFDAVLHQGEALALHNAWPRLWAALNREALEAAGLGAEGLSFHRSAGAGSVAATPLFWLGDQLVSWDAHDGLQSAVTGLLNAGLSGMAFNHSDVGGYTTLDRWPVQFQRSRELLLRWAEFAAFTPVFRSHEGNRPALNWQADQDAATTLAYARMARLHQCWRHLRRTLADEASTRGWPLLRWPWLHEPALAGPVAPALQQFLLGPDLMVAPVLEPGVVQRSVHLPPGRWTHVWSGRTGGGDRQVWPAPLGSPPAFVREGSAAAAELLPCVRELQAPRNESPSR